VSWPYVHAGLHRLCMYAAQQELRCTTCARSEHCCVCSPPGICTVRTCVCMQSYLHRRVEQGAPVCHVDVLLVTELLQCKQHVRCAALPA
jgi:hypothetical protein